MAYIEPVNEYVFTSWSNAFKDLGVEVFKTKPETHLKFIYQDYDSYDFDKRNSEADFVYSYIYRKAITRKNYLSSTIHQYRAKRPESVLHNAYPESFNFELDYPEFLDDALDECYELKQELELNDKLWILKPALGERAHGIHLFRTQKDLQSIFDTNFNDEEAMQQYVVQEYIKDVLLVDGFKFHLRVYVLCVGKLEVFVNNDVLMLFSNQKYTTDNITDMRGHLTNTCFQEGEARVELLSSLEGHQEIKLKIDSVVRDLFLAAEGNPVNFQSLPNAIEFFGLDFLVTKNLDVKLLECNAYPDFKQTGSDLRHVVETMFKQTASYLITKTKPAGMTQVI